MSDTSLLQAMLAAKAVSGGGGGGGDTTNYNDLSNKPQINGNTLSGNKTSAQLGLASTSDIPTTLAELSDDSTHRTVTDTEKVAWNAKASTATATTSTAGLMSSADKTKLNGIAEGAEVNVQSDWNVTSTTSDAYIKNKPTIPTTLSQLTEDSTHRVVTDTEKATWNGKQDAPNVLFTNRNTGTTYTLIEQLTQTIEAGQICRLTGSVVYNSAQPNGIIISRSNDAGLFNNVGNLLAKTETEENTSITVSCIWHNFSSANQSIYFWIRNKSTATGGNRMYSVREKLATL